ncbi:hypothetical protein DAPPUDRAFT_265087 [Daphnia pulex]|uniref:Uncharacterized protein n=1 Tax=Daphnia pulex TaxID=6669 RepID=E9HSU9_DAPPU|nr:hypothetical protein DAPPUDRAFT_265087 [Daphnia pulex]|eukprot:EFX65179.1 hypothetical protein DAPPUDRAFT_265087 [Daphnia pulex]
MTWYAHHQLNRVAELNFLQRRSRLKVSKRKKGENLGKEVKEESTPSSPKKGPANIPARKAGYGEERRRPPANRAGGRRRGSAVVPAVKAVAGFA